MTKPAFFRLLVPGLLAIASVGCKPAQIEVGGTSTGSGGTTGVIGSGGTPGVMGTGGTSKFTGSGGAAGVGPTTCSVICGSGSSVGTVPVSPMIKPEFTPQLGTTFSQPTAPPALSGGTLLMLSDLNTIVAADPDRDMIYVVDLPSRTLTHTIGLRSGDEPGRLVEDGAGRVHVALRGGGALATCDPATGQVIARRPVCAAPRGVAYEAATDRVHVACHDGQLVSFPAAGGAAVRRLQLDDDLRDVLVDGDTLLVTRFRSAEVLTVASDGTVTSRVQPPTFTSSQAHLGARFSASVAWRAVPAPGGGALVLHQRGMVDPVAPAAGGYGGPNTCDTIVHGCITRIGRDGSTRTGPALASLVLAIDLALSPDGTQVAVVAAGNATNTDMFAAETTPALTRVFLTDLEAATDPKVGCSMDGKHAPCSKARVISPPSVCGVIGGSGGTGGTACTSDPSGVPDNVGQPISVAFDGTGSLIVQSREPAMLALGDGTTISLSAVSRGDTGHTMFHANAGGFLACASCHPEGNEDGRTWNFTCEGPRRTQSLQTGLAGTEPFHWDGSETDFGHLTIDVLQGRMSGPSLLVDQQAALLGWLDAQPRAPKPAATDSAAVAHGQALFQDPARGCATCHAGPRLTNNQTVDVGTGGPFQVPSLVGVGSRAPYLHDGCAATLADRFGSCGGGDRHGITSTLSASDVSDLVAYLKTL